MVRTEKNATTCPWHLPGARSRALAHEELVDVVEWCVHRKLPLVLPLPAAMTSGLCDAIERVPFRMVGRTTADQRSRDVFERAARALERCVHGWLQELEPESCFTLRFAAPLPCSASDPSWRMLKLHCGPAGGEKSVLTIGLDDEL